MAICRLIYSFEPVSQIPADWTPFNLNLWPIQPRLPVILPPAYLGLSSWFIVDQVAVVFI